MADPILALDIGGSNSHGALLAGNRVLSTVTVAGNGRPQVRRCFGLLERRAGVSTARLVLTGGKSRGLRPEDFPRAFTVVDEIQALAAGGAFLWGGPDVFVASLGTGTAFISVCHGRGVHVGGTGVGGGTLTGLARLLLRASPSGAEQLARGAARRLDLSVRDIAGRGVGRVPAQATASNFGRVPRRPARAGIAASLLNLIGEAVGTMAFFAAQAAGQERSILLCGRVAADPLVSRRATAAVRLFGGQARTDRRGEYCAAIGAARLLKRGERV